MTCIADSLQGASQMFWLHFWGAVMPSCTCHIQLIWISDTLSQV